MKNIDQKNYLNYLIELENIINYLNEENFENSVEKIIDFFDQDFPHTFIHVISQLIFSSFISQNSDATVLLQFLNQIQTKKDTLIKKDYTTKEILTMLNFSYKPQESYYLINKMIENGMVDPSFVKSQNTLYFAHYKTDEEIINCINEKLPFHKYFSKNYENLSKNDWELHKKLIEEGHNPNEITKIIRNDEIEKLQEIATQENFDFNQTIETSLYERCSFINHYDVTLMDYAAFFSSIKCFKYLLMNGANVENTGKYAVAGGNLEIIHLCEQNHSSFDDSYEIAIEFHRNDIFKYLYENNIYQFKDSTIVGKKCIIFFDYSLLSFLEKEGLKTNEILIHEAAKIGNIYLVKYFLDGYDHIPNDILYYSIISRNVELVKYFIEQKNIDVNTKNTYFLTYNLELFYMI